MAHNKIPRSFGTHDGSFHADEVTACAMLILFDLIDKDKVLRSRNDSELANCEYICDVGGIYDPARKLFDHHQHEYQGPLSSAGMILNYLRQIEILNSKQRDFFEYSLILGVDSHDNGKELHSKGVCTYSHVVSNFNPIKYDSGPKAQDKSFFEALDFAIGHLTRMWERYKYTHSCEEIVIEAMQNGKGFLLFDQSIPWLDIFFEQDGIKHPATFVVMPAGEHWKLRGIPPSLEEKMKVRHPLPEEWAGLLGDELKKASGIEGAIFCHKGRFVSVWETKEDALKALQMIISKKL